MRNIFSIPGYEEAWAKIAREQAARVMIPRGKLPNTPPSKPLNRFRYGASGLSYLDAKHLATTNP